MAQNDATVRSHLQRKFDARVGVGLQKSQQTCTYRGRGDSTTWMSKFKKNKHRAHHNLFQTGKQTPQLRPSITIHA